MPALSVARVARCASFFAVLALAGCGGKTRACNELAEELDPITVRLERASASGPSVPAPGDEAACAKFGAVAREVEAARGELRALEVEDEGLAQRLDVYTGHVDGWLEAERGSQASCEASEGDPMLESMGQSFHHSAQLAYAIAEINSHCRARW